MRKIVFRTSGPYSGCDSAEIVEFDDDSAECEIYGELDMWLWDHWQRYGADEDDSGVEVEVDGWWEEYDSEKHDGIL